jgi:tetratricopeptide (TPR) repeat protein
MGFWARSVSFDDARAYPARGAAKIAAALGILACLAGVVRFYGQWRAEILYFDGFKKVKVNDLTGAIAALERAHAYRRWEVNSDYELGNAYARQAQWAAQNQLTDEAPRLAKKAVWAYDEAIAANAGYDELYFNKAAVLAQERRLPEAILAYRIALLINPLSPDSYKALGNLYLADPAKREAGLELFERGVFFFPRDRDMWVNAGYFHSQKGEDGKALAAFERAVSLDFQYPVAWKNFRSTLERLGKKDHPYLRLPAVWDALQAAASKSQWPEARRAAEELTKIVPENARAWLALANVDAMTGGRDAEAVAEYKKVLGWEPTNWEARLNLAKVDARGNRRDEALELARALAQERPQDKEAAALLASLGASLQPRTDLVE